MQRHQQAMQRHQEMQRQEDLSRQEEQRQQQYQQQQQQEQQVQQFSQMAVESGTTVSEHRSFQQQQQSQESFQQSSSVSKQQEVFEATERDGAMRGYQPKGVDETGRRSAMARDSGLFGGIGGDDNSLVDNEFDYKKHSVKDL